jgi:hypothetical protein
VGALVRHPGGPQVVRAVAAAAVIAQALIGIDPRYPTLGEDALRELRGAKRGLEEEAPDGAPADPFESATAHAPTGAEASTDP